MKKVILSMAIATMVFATANGQNTITEATEVVKGKTTNIVFGVRGNCGMCKTTIEKAANSVEGVFSAVWDKEAKKIDVSFDASKTDAKVIHNAIAASGYDTESVKANDGAYSNLPGCCQYDKEMEMNISTKKKDDHSGHKH